MRKDTYSVYGFISTNSTRQFIRVKPLDEPLRADANRVLDATVRLHNEETGTTYRLRDSLITFVDQGDSLVTHNFWTEADVRPKTRYRLSVSRGGEVVTSATTTTPTGQDASATKTLRNFDAPPDFFAPPPDSGTCRTKFRIRFRDASRKPARLRGKFLYDGTEYSFPIEAPIRRLDNGDPFVEVVPRALVSNQVPAPEQICTDVPFAPPCPTVPPCVKLDAPTLEYAYTYVSPDWGTLSDNLDSLGAVGPGNFIQYVVGTQVNNGHGFFGAVRREEISITVARDTLCPVLPGPEGKPIRTERRDGRCRCTKGTEYNAAPPPENCLCPEGTEFEQGRCR